MPWTPLKGIARAIIKQEEKAVRVSEFKRALMNEIGVTGKDTLRKYIRIAEEMGWIEFDGTDILKLRPERIEERWR